MSSRHRPYTAAGLGAAAGGTLAWGMGIVLIKLTSSPFLVVSFYRLLFSIPILVVAWRLASDRRLPWRAGTLGGVLFALHQMAHVSALRYSTAAVVTIFFSLQPVVVGALSRRVTGEGATRAFSGWALVAASGCTILVLASSHERATTPVGTALAAANLLVWCAYYLATKRARDTTGTISWLLVMSVVACVIVGGAALVARQPLSAPTGREWAYLAAIALVPGTLGHVLVTWAHPRLHVGASSAVVIGVPIVSTVGAAIFAREPYTPLEALGALVALAGTASAVRHLPAPAVLSLEGAAP